jgi:serine/threonine protein kinase/tetratricopeptide (TPR) repeat protein
VARLCGLAGSGVTDEHPFEQEPASGARPLPWRGSARYEVVRVIGHGGMGIVYEAIDHELRQRVALKTLRNFDPDALYRFKNEFRTLADLRHSNLVRLHEFVMTDAERVFFSMELVRGDEFRTYVWRPEIRAVRAPSGRTSDSSPPTQRSGRVDRTSDAPSAEILSVGGPSPADMGRLRAALLGLAEGLEALHAAGKLHRDIKPSNVLVTPEGRVVLLDFGVATELASPRDEDRGLELVGTTAYMAPELAIAEPPTTASDWYSVGVVLYEALVGRPPFLGSTLEVLQRKNLMEASAPSAVVAGVPADLDDLCRGLLNRDPALRLAGANVLAQLRHRGSRTSSSLRPPALADVAFVGREQQIAQLRDALEAVRAGRSVTVRVGGTSGMGKSTLVQRFLDELSTDGSTLVLRGRAYERESVPYKAVDSVIDALSRYLMRWSDEDREPLRLPDHMPALARLFPVLRRVPSVAAAEEERTDSLLEVRRRAVAALRALLGGLARRQTLVIYIDDVQWGDTDSATLLVDLVRPPDAPPLLLVMTYRDNEAAPSTFLTEMRAHWPAGAEARDLTVGPLDPPDAQRLALALFENADAIGQRVARAAARESRGSPFLIEELVRSNLAAAAAGEDTLTVLTVERMVSERLERLSQDAQRLLEIVAVGGRPLPLSIVADAAGIYEDIQGVVERVVSGRFIRTGLRGGHETVEMSHDRLREAIVSRLPPTKLSGLHERLARVLESTPGADLEALALHLRGANITERAAIYAERAAEQAAAKLAFDQAVRLYKMALEMVPASLPDQQRLRTRLAQVLEWAGRGADAALVYLHAAEGAPGLQRIEFERAAAEQLLTTGRIDEGMIVLDRALAFVGLSRPRSALMAIVWLLLYRIYLRVRGLRFHPREPDEIARLDRARIDTLYSVGVGLSFVDAVQGACMQARHLILALRVGDRFQVLRAATIEAATLASAGGKPGVQERRLSGLVQSLAAGAQDPESQAFALGTTGVSLFLRGQWSQALDKQDVAYAKYAVNKAGWHANGQLFAIWSLTFLGRIDEFRRRHTRLLLDAEDHGDLYTTVNLRIGYSNLAWLVTDDVEAARREVINAMSAWSQRSYHLQHYRAMLAEANIELYAGAGARAYERVVRDWAELKKSFLLRVQYVRADAHFVRARAALASSLEGATRRARIAEAQHLARRIGSEDMAWTLPLADMVRAGVASFNETPNDASRLLTAALRGAEAADMTIHAAAIRRQLGVLIGGDEGRALTAQADHAMTSQGVRVPERLAAMLAPGRWRVG